MALRWLRISPICAIMESPNDTEDKMFREILKLDGINEFIR